MEKFKSELHYYLREKLWHSAIALCTDELDKGRDPYVSFWRGFASSQEGGLIEAIRDVEPLKNENDFRYSTSLALLHFYGLYPNPDENKMDQIRTDMDIDAINRNDCLNSMRLCVYLNDEEQYMLLEEKLESLKGSDGEDYIIKGWKLCYENDSKSWEEAKTNFQTYIKEFGNENIDAIFGGLKCLERIIGTQKGKSYDEILDTYLEILKTNNNFIPLHIERIKTYLLKNDYENAMDYINNKLNNIHHFEIYKILALCNLMQEGDFQKAIYNLNKMWELVEQKEPKNPNLYYNIALLFMNVSDRNKDILNICEKIIDKAIEFNPNCANYLIQKAYLYLYKGDIQQASDLFEKCGEKDSSNKENSIGLIWCKIYQNKYQEAYCDVQYLKEMYEQISIPKNYKICLFEAITQTYMGGNEETVLNLAKEALRVYIQTNKSLNPMNKYEVIINTNYDFLLDLAEVLLSFYDFNSKITINSIPDTIRQAQRILSLLNKNKYLLTGRLLIGKLEFLLYDFNKAFEIVDDIINIDPKNIEALMFKALLCIETKDFRRAKEVINEAMINNLNETKENSSFLVLKSRMELGLNDIEHSQESLNKAISNFELTLSKINPCKYSLFKLTHKDKLDLMKLNIDILMKLEKTEEAQSYMNKLVVEFQDMGDELLMLHSDLAIKTGDLKKAVHLLHKIDDKDEKLFKKSRIKLSEIYLNQVMDRRLYSWCYTEIIEKYPTFDNYKLAANALMQINSPDEAAEYYKKALRIKNDMEVMRDLGTALVKTHDYREAIDYYIESAKVDERMINNQTVVHFWQMMNDYIELLYLLARNTKSENSTNINKVITLKEQIQDNITKLKSYLQKYNEFHLQSILSKFKYTLGKVLFYLYQERNSNSQSKKLISEVNKKDIFTQFEEAANLEKEILQKLKDSKIEDEIKKSKELLSLIYYEMGQYYEIIDPKQDSCEKAYSDSVNYDETNMEALFGISNLLMKKAKYSEAQNYVNMLLKEDESNDDALALLVSILNAKRDNQSSMDYLLDMIQKQPNSYHLMELYINLLYRSGKIANGKDILYKSERLQKFVFTPGLYYCKGIYNKYLGEINKALIEFSKAKTDENYGTKCIEQILEIYMNPDCDILLVDLDLPWNQKDSKNILNYSTQDLNLDAINFLLRELKLRRDDDKTKIYEMYSAILSKNDSEIKQQIANLKNLLNKNKDNLPVQIAYIMGNLIVKNIEEAKSGLSIMDGLTPNIKYYTDYERGFLIMAYILMMTDNYKKAEESINKVLSLNVSQIKAYEYLALIKEKQGKTEESCGYYEKAWEYSNKNNANIGYHLAINYINSRQHVKALNVCNEIQRKFKDYPIDEIALQAKNGLNQ